MIPVYTQKTLDKLTWLEVQKLHKSLKLKASPNARTRRDLQNNIVAAMPQPVVESEQVATPLTCASCPLATQIEGNRYCCTVSQTASDVKRGHWEATSDCYEAVADTQTETETTKIIAETEAPITPQVEVATITQVPHAYREESLVGAISKESAEEKRMADLAYLAELEMKAQLAIEATVPGSEEEAKAIGHLRKIERNIELYDRPAPRADETETDEIQAEGTIHWHSPSTGTITGKNGALRNFYLRSSGEIMIVINSSFTASESKSPNIRHQQIRSAIESGRTFNPRVFKSSADFEQNTEPCNGGRIRQECDGRWWAWRDNGITGHPFPFESQALQYLARVSANNTQKQAA